MKKNSIFRFLAFILILILYSSGCQNTTFKVTSTNTSYHPTATESEQTSISQITLTPKRKQGRATDQPYPIATDIVLSPTLKPYPTISPAEAAIWVSDLMKDNGGCQFPCWWGITPGETTWEKAYEILFPISQEDRILKTNVFISNVEANNSFSAGFEFVAGREEIGQGYIIRKNIVDLIEIRFGKYRSHSLSKLISTYGTPEEIWISTYNMEAQGSLPFDVLLVYPSKGISAYFHSLDAKVKGDQVQKCFGNETILVLDLWDPNSGESYEQRTKEMPMLEDMASFDQFQKLVTTTDLTPDSFAEDLTGPGHSVCINTPSRFWKSPFQ